MYKAETGGPKSKAKSLEKLFLVSKVKKGSTRTQVMPERQEVKVGAVVAEGVMGEAGAAITR